MNRILGRSFTITERKYIKDGTIYFQRGQREVNDKMLEMVKHEIRELLEESEFVKLELYSENRMEKK